MSAPDEIKDDPCVQNDWKKVIQFPLLDHPSLFHFFGTRLLDKDENGSDCPKNMDEMLSGGLMVRCLQVHGAQVCHVKGSGDTISRDLMTGDGLTADFPNICIAVSTADCVPVLLFDPVKRAVSAVHAGWRGTVLNIAARAVEAMAQRYHSQAKDIRAGIGPSIRSCCFEVGREVWAEVQEKYPYGNRVVKSLNKEKAMLDLPGLNRLQLLEAGLRSENVSDSGLCTSCFPDLFFSYRRDGKKLGNMTSGIMLTSV